MAFWLIASVAMLSAAGLSLVVRAMRQRHVHLWLRSYLRGSWRPPAVAAGTTRHLMFCCADHFEPRWENPSYETECARVARWRSDYPRLCAGHYDADGRAPVHTFFYPEEEYRSEHIHALVELCREGLAELEVHLHHDHDTDAGLREKLRRFTDVLAHRHDALSRDPLTGQPRWGFIHGNWALDNSHPTANFCGVNNELQVLAGEGCYADFTLPSAPSPCQTRTINSIYYATDDPSRPKSHDTGQRVRVGGSAVGDLMIIQGPLGLNWRSRRFAILPRIENADLRTTSLPGASRVDAWVNTGVHVQGRPEWVFVKVHTHGAPERDVNVLLGEAMASMFGYLESRYNNGRQWKLHYVSAREMYNIIKAAEADCSGDPGRFRDYLIPRPRYGIAAS
jgi:hypothetical protein